LRLPFLPRAKRGGDAPQGRRGPYVFAGGNDGSLPDTGLTADSGGNYYGATYAGGGTNCASGCGTVFEYSAAGVETVLYAFQGGSDGWTLEGTLIEDRSGNFYGETLSGGNYNGSNCDVYGCGTVFELKPGGNKITLYDFQAGGDGYAPDGGLIFDSAGNLDGTTDGGGGAGCGGYGCGTVFQIAPDGTDKVLYAFQGGSDGSGPVGLITDHAGNLYGATVEGRKCPPDNDCGTIFKLASDGTKSLVYDFQGGPHDGRTPTAALIMDKAGKMYGTTFFGGTGCKSVDGCGTVFELTPSGKETVLYEFVHSHGSNPEGPLLLGKQGELYGTAGRGGKHNYGAVFEVKD
jgi:uncharacterized repeat protein (TIGR03803 family)